MSIQTNPRVNKFQRVLSMKGWNEKFSNISLLSGPKFTTPAFLKKKKENSRGH